MSRELTAAAGFVLVLIMGLALQTAMDGRCADHEATRWNADTWECE